MSPQFLAPWTYDTGARPAAVAVADVTADGRNDLVVTNGFGSDPSAEGALVVFPQAADGSLDAPVRYATSEDPAAVSNSRMGLAAGDLNGDGLVDVAVATNAGVDIFLQSGGQMTAPLLVPGTANAQEVRIGDVNGDGLSDLVATTHVPGSWPETGSVLLLLNTGSGFVVSTIFTGAYAQEIRLGDLTGDGRLDVADYSSDRQPTPVNVFVQTASGSFTVASYAGGNVVPDAFALADVNGDGRLDLVLAEGGNGADLRVFPQQQDGTLGASFTVYSHDNPAGLEAGDLDGDGNADLVAYHFGGPTDSAVGVGDWLVQPIAGLAPEVVSDTGDIVDNLPPEALAVGDLNGDGANDVAYSSYNLGVTVLRQAGSDTSAPDTTITSGPANPTTSTSATFTFGASEPGTRFECALDSHLYSYCSSPITYSGLQCCGTYSFYVRAIDTAGNVDQTPAWYWWVEQAPPTSDFSLTASPSSLSLAQGGSGSSTISTAVASGSAQSVSLSASGQPAGTTVGFAPSTVTAGGSSTMTVAVGASTAAGSYTITVTGAGTSATHTTTVTLTVTPSSSDFSLSASPSSLSVAQGGSGSSTISTAVTSGSAQSVSLSASGQPAGTTVGFAPSTVTAGGSSTMTVAVGASTATGSYTITVTGTGTSATRTTTVALTVTAAGGVVNGDFETGSLSGWTTGGGFSPRAVTTAHGGAYAAQLGSTSAFNGDSTLTQAVAIPSGSSRLTFWYQPHCPDTITYDQIQMQIRSTSGATLATVLNVCSNSGTWTSVGYDTSAFAGQTVVLWFNGHDDGYAGDPTYLLLDDVALSPYTSGPNVVQNPGFETGSPSSWTASGAFTPVVTTTAHSGSYSARLGSTSAVNGNSTLTQTVTVPTGSPTLTFWYQPHCTDTITYDQIQMQIRSKSGATLATVLNVCSNSGAWTNVGYSMAAYTGQTVVLWFNDHDDGYPTDPTYFLIDDVTLK